MKYDFIKQPEESMSYFGINWALTTACNYRCSYCHPDLHNGKIKPPPIEKIMRFIDSISVTCHNNNINPYFEFGGGEVTYLPWFSQLLTLIHKHKGLASIISNGSSPLKWWKKHIHMLHSVSLSYHIDEVKHDERFFDVAEFVANSPFTHLQINIMMVPQRFDECLKFAKKLKEAINCGISLQPLYHGFGGGGITGRYSYSAQQELIMETFRGNSITKNIPTPRGMMKVGSKDGSISLKSSFELLVHQETNFSGWQCYAGIDNIIITFEGDIYRAWCMQDKPIGNIFHEELTLPTAPTLCRTSICQCGPDICSTKLKMHE